MSHPNQEKPLKVDSLASILTIATLSFSLIYAITSLFYTNLLVIKLGGVSHEKIFSNNTLRDSLTLFIVVASLSSLGYQQAKYLQLVLQKIHEIPKKLLGAIFIIGSLFIFHLAIWWQQQVYLLLLTVIISYALSALKPTRLAAACGCSIILSFLLSMGCGLVAYKKPLVLVPTEITYTQPEKTIIPSNIYQVDNLGQLVETKDKQWLLLTSTNIIKLAKESK